MTERHSNPLHLAAVVAGYNALAALDALQRWDGCDRAGCCVCGDAPHVKHFVGYLV
jgi:hypothetical protein